MRLALISNTAAGMVNHAVRLTNKGHDVGIFIPETLCPRQPANSSVNYFPLPSLPDLFHNNTRIITAFPVQIPLLLDKFRPEIVHFENPQVHLFFWIWSWCKIHNKPLLTSVSGSEQFRINKILRTMSDLTFDPAGNNQYEQTLNQLLHR